MFPIPLSILRNNCTKEGNKVFDEILGLLVYNFISTLLLLNMTCPVLANSVDPDQLASSFSC